MSLFHGLSAFPLTPTDEHGNVQRAFLARFVDRIVDAGADSIGLLGSTGGYAYLTQEQRREAVHLTVDRVGGRMPVIVGVGALRTDAAVELARDANAAGAAGLLMAPMSYTPLTDSEVFYHFAEVSEAGGLPLCIYNNPGTTGFTFSADLIARLASLPYVAAIKMPPAANGDFAGELARLRERTPEGFAIGYSGDWAAADAMLAGCDAWFSVIAGLLPEPALALTRAVRASKEEEARRIDAAFQPLWALFKAHGSFRVMFTVADVLGLGAPLPPRPVLSIPNGERPAVEAAVKEIVKATRRRG